MRIAFFLLVLANLVFFAWAQGYFGGEDAGREPQRLADQLNPGKMTVTVREKTVPVAQACRLVGGLAAGDVESLHKALGEGVGLRALEETSWWVSINALPNKAAADKKAAELKLLGVTDFHVLQAEGGSFAVSLGVLDSEAAATELLQALGRKGVKSARVEAKAKVPARVELRGPADLLAKRLPEAIAGVAGASVSDCP